MNKRLTSRFGGRVTAELDGDIIRLTGKLSNWNDIVQAGLMSAKRGFYIVNDISGVERAPMRLPSVNDEAIDGMTPDVLVIGGGIVGCAVARELTRYRLDVLLVDKEYDVALHASSRNDGMVHPGIDLIRGELKKHYTDLANPMFDKLCADLGVPFKRVGQYLCFSKRYLLPLLRLTMRRWKRLGITARALNERQLRNAEAHVSDGAKCAIYYPTTGVVNPYELVIAYAENAIRNGARISLNTAALSMDVQNGIIKSVITNRGTVYPKLVINAAGVFADEVANMANDRFFSIHPRRGTNLILDKKAAWQVNTIVSSVGGEKNTHSKGGGVVRTADGNILAGPNAAEAPEREDFSTDRASVDEVLSRQSYSIPSLNRRDIITCFTGIRAATYEEDFIVGYGHKTSNIIHAAGIQSPGLTAAPAIALDVARMASERLNAADNPDFDAVRPPIPCMRELSFDERDALIKRDPAYGQIVCRCEEVSLGELRDALRRPLPCDSLDGLKRRVRAGMGRCQGGFCSPLAAQLISEELGIPIEQVKRNSETIGKGVL